MAKPSKYVVVYDVTDDRERTAVAKLVEGFGIRVQKSAFECHLTKGPNLQLQRRVKALQLKSGYVFIYRLDVRSKRISLGVVPDNPLDESHYAFVT